MLVDLPEDFQLGKRLTKGVHLRGTRDEVPLVNIDYSVVTSVVDRMRQLRKEKGMTAQALEDALAEVGVTFTRAIIANLETGRRDDLKLREIVALAYVFGVALDWLILGSGPRCMFCMDNPPIGFICSSCGVKGL